MANLDWPPEEAFKYEFRDELALSIPLIDNEKKLKRGRPKKSESDKGRE